MRRLIDWARRLPSMSTVRAWDMRISSRVVAVRRPVKRTMVRFYSDRAETCPTTSLCRVHDLLPMFDQPPRERSDAARNREALLAAAARLVEDHGVDAVTMDSVAAAAGVGKGTVFRRFDSREGLMAALLNRSETDWQGLVISGPPPLGPGAPAIERLHAFGHSRMEVNLQHAELIRAAGRAGERSYAAVSFAAMHMRYLLGQL